MTYSNQCSLKKAQAALGAKAYSLWLDVETDQPFNVSINRELLVDLVMPTQDMRPCHMRIAV